MGEKDYDRENEYSPNPPFVIGGGQREGPEAERSRLYRQHRAAGSLETYFAMYPLDRPWGYGLTPEERASAEGRQLKGNDRDAENER